MRPLTFQILRELSAAHFTSGTMLAAKLGLSRSAISDALMEATDNGVSIFKLTRRGYKLAAPLDFLNLAQIRQHLAQDAGRVDIDILETAASTSTELLRRAAAANLPSGTCIAAELQTAGRGRRGRQWQSGLATSLTFSLLWRFEKGAAQLGGLSLVVGLAIVKALRTSGIAKAQLKWPNDILVEEKKLGGILIETQGDMLGPTMAVIGIGININLPDTMKQMIDQPVTDFTAHANAATLDTAATSISRNQLLATLLGALIPALGKFNTVGFAAVQEEWLACHAYQNRTVHVLQNAGESFDAVVTGVAVDGSLRVKKMVPGGLNGSEILLSSAEISVRPIDTKPAVRRQSADMKVT